MSTKLIGALIIVLMLWAGYRLFIYYKEVDAQRYAEKQQSTGKDIDPSRLHGLPYQLEQSLTAAKNQGAPALKKWLKQYDNQIADPRKAWIQLDYCTMVARDNPQEARAVFTEVKERLKEDSPVYPRLKQLEKSFD